MYVFPFSQQKQLFIYIMLTGWCLFRRQCFLCGRSWILTRNLHGFHASGHKKANFLTLHLLHFPTLYPFSDVPVPEGAVARVRITLQLKASQSVSQSVLVSSSVWGSWSDIYSCRKVTVQSIWGALSDERRGLSFVRVSSKSFVSIYIVFTNSNVSTNEC
jgi:hypothetical protein